MKSHPQTDLYVTCPTCQALNDRFATYCHECGAPIGTTATLDPIASVHTQSFLFRKAADSRPKMIVLIGTWILFLPVFLVTGYMAIYSITHQHGLLGFAAFWLAVGVACLSLVMLYRVTKNYMAPAKDDSGR
ncbi:MAG TPA: zinc ribbon domain-containing protein [Pyrinomonadaceae bacterium]|nr:zinc ribbon domain-containing protein [Pyrinomonadaceae bacterium]